MTPPDQTDGPADEIDTEPTADDLAVHAVLDGEASADQRRRVAGDPHLRARVTEMKAVVDQVASPPQAPDEGVFDAIRAAAVAHVDDPEEVLDLREGVDPDDAEPSPPAEPARGAEVVRIDERGTGEPTRRHRRWPALPAVAAVVVLLVALGVGLIVTDDDDPPADLTAVGSQLDDSSSGDSDSSEGASAEERGAGDEASDAPSTTVAPDGSLGAADDASDVEPQASFPDDAALREVLQEVDPATLVLVPGQQGFAEEARPDNLARAATPQITRCGTVLQSSDPTIGPVQAATVVEVDGETLFVLSSPVTATDATPAATLLHVVDPVSCVPRFAVQR